MTETSGAEDVCKIGNSELYMFDGIWFLDRFTKSRQELNSFVEAQFGDNDILVATYPKSGTAWLERILALIKNEADIEKTDQKKLVENSKMLEWEKVPAVMADEEPRIIKNHFHYKHIPRSFREGKGKIVYLVRNPKDTAVSFFYFGKMMKFSKPDRPFSDYLEDFISGKVPYGSWFEHVKSFWEHRNDANVLWLTYEELHMDSKSKIAEIAAFWGKELTEQQISIIAEASSYNSMKKNPATNYSDMEKKETVDSNVSKYFRKGIVGDWKSHFTEEESERIDEIMEKDLEPLGIRFSFE